MNNINPFIFHYNTDEKGNPTTVYIEGESVQTSPLHYCVQLKQIPKKNKGLVVLDDTNNELSEVNKMSKITPTSYYVDYNNGVVYFHPSKAGKIFIFNYYGLGYELLSASRVFSEHDVNGQTIRETLQEIIDKGRECIDALNTIGNAIELLKRIENYIIEATKLDVKLKEDIRIGDQLHIDLTNTINNGKTLDTNLGNKITTGTKLDTDLGAKITNGDTLKNDLTTKIAEGNTTKENLDQSRLEAQDDIATIKATGNGTYTIPSSAWVGAEPNLTYTINHKMNSKDLIVAVIDTSTQKSVMADYRIVDMNNIEMQSMEATSITVTINAKYYSGKDANIIASEVIDARGGEIDLNGRFNNLQNTLGGDINSFWSPPIQPTYDEIINNQIPEMYYKNLWDSLLVDGYSKKELLGKDQTGTYDIYKYVFEPKNYEKTIIITSNVHGWEVKGQKILYRFMHHVVNDCNKYSQLNYIRNKVRIIIIPIANPWGLYNNTRENGRGVDINRNFNYNWSKNTSPEKGSSPLSEKETQYINNTIIEYSDITTVGVIDIHNTNAYTPEANEAHYYASVPMDGNGKRNFLNELMEQVKPKGFNVTKIFNNSDLPSISNQAGIYNKLNAFTIEWSPNGIYGIPDNTKEDVREALKFIGNAILKTATFNTNANVNVKEPFTVEMSTLKTDITKNNNEYSVIPQMEYTFTPSCDGIIIVSCETTFVNTTDGGLNFICPVVTQPSHPMLNVSSSATQCSRNEVYCDSSNKTVTLTANRHVGVFTKSQDYGDVTISLMWRCTQGVINHRRSRMFITFIPSDVGRKYSVYEPNSSGDMVQVF